MWMARSRMPMLRVFCLAAGLLAAGCADHGSYHLSWVFAGDESPVSGCGRHGVDAIRVTGTNTDGEAEDASALCSSETFARSVAVGTWTFTIHQIDVRGRPILLTDDQGQLLPDPTATANITKDADTPLDPEIIVLAPRAACADGVDNEDGGVRGRVDLDDPMCAGPAKTTAE